MTGRGPAEEIADVVVIGGGHNGLVCAAYLARGGLDVVVLERNDRCGGALFSSRAGGTTLEHGGVEHTTIVASTIPDELDLAEHGLEYSHRTLAGVHRFGDGVQIVVAETAAETAASISALDPRDGDAWLELVATSRRLFDLLADVGEGRPMTPSLLQRGARLLPAADRAVAELAAMSVAELASDRFASPHVRAMAIARSSFSGLPGWAPGTAAVFCLTPGGHGRRFSRPIGGSNAFVSALRRAADARGVRIRTGMCVESIRSASDSSWEVSAGSSGRFRARHAVVHAAAPTDLVRLVRPLEVLPTRLVRGLRHVEVVAGNLSQFTLAASLAEPPDWPADLPADAPAAMLWLVDRPGDVMEGHAAAAVGSLPRRPSVVATFPSVVDATAAPPGESSMWVNGFLARHLSGRPWVEDDVAIAAEAVWSTVERCLPGVRARVSAEVFTSPADLTARTGMENPGSHLATSVHQLLGGRPVRGFARHRAGRGIYMTGAGTGAGPSISGLPGRSCARAVLDDVTRGGVPGRARSMVDMAGAEARRARRLLELVTDRAPDDR
ncbi:MAG: NAD(P)/FAD-dependent oxidoreductase [Actinomycetota bacterium]